MTRGYLGWEIADERAKAFYKRQLLTKETPPEPVVRPIAVTDISALV
jgi:hypothetical protein